MGGPIEDAMSGWHKKYGSGYSQSDRQYYANLDRKYRLTDSSKWQSKGSDFVPSRPEDEERKRIRETGNRRDYIAYISAYKEANMHLYHHQEYVELFDTTGEHTGTGKWGWRDDLEMSITEWVPNRRRYKVKNPYWTGRRSD